MKTVYNDLFKAIIKAYYEGNFKEQIKELIEDENVDNEYLSEVISSLCGVKVGYSENYTKDLEEAVKTYSSDHKVVNKVMKCNMACADSNGETNCSKSCPFSAIIVDKENHVSRIDEDRCTDCGLCVEACTEGKILDKIEFIPLANLLKENTPVIAAVAPAIVGQFGKDVTINQLRAAFKKIGFADMVEVAFFADMLTLKEAVEFDHMVRNKDDFMITSCCCPMWVGMLKKVYSGLQTHVSPSVSPMIAAGRVLKKINSDCKVVFIGPCIAKKAEAKDKDIAGDIDYVMTFQELKTVFDALEVEPSKLQEDISTEYASRGGRLYARTGGVSIAVGDAIGRMYPEKHSTFYPVQANGVAECKAILAKAQNGEIEANFIEGMGCVGGCVGGPKAIIPRTEGRQFVNNFADSSNIKVALDSSCMELILKKIDIASTDDFKHKEKIEIFERKFE